MNTSLAILIGAHLQAQPLHPAMLCNVDDVLRIAAPTPRCRKLGCIRIEWLNEAQRRSLST